MRFRYEKSIQKYYSVVCYSDSWTKLHCTSFRSNPFTGIAIGGIGGASGAGLFGSMASASGINIGWSQSGSDAMDAMWNELNPDHVYFSGEKHEADPQTYPEDIWDYITVDLGDWLQAQQDFISNFVTEYNVTDNDSGTISNIVYCNGVPLYLDNTTYFGSYATVGVTVYTTQTQEILTPDGYTWKIKTYYNNNVVEWEIWQGSTKLQNAYSSGQTSGLVRLGYYATTNNPQVWHGLQYPKGNYGSTIVQVGTKGNTGTINYTSGTINTHVFDGWENAKVKIPHSISGLTSGWTVPDFTNALTNLWNTGQQGQIVIEDTDQPIPPPPIPSTPLGDTPFDDWVDLWGQGIYQQLENQSDALDLIGSNGIDQIEELESIDSNLEDLTGTAESIDTNIGIGNGLLGGIKSAAESAVEFLEGIAEHVEELVEEVVQATETLIAGILNQIPSVFGVIFGPIKQASSIWHYVVEWIQSISAPMSWMWSMASGTSYNIVLPVYASLAGAVVLAFYKRFGK